MSTLRVYAFAANGASSEPVTGLTLADFSIDVYRTNKDTQAVSQIVAGAAMLKEIGEGFYLYTLTNIDDVVYDYHATVQYTGAEVLDTDLWVGTDAGYAQGKFATLLSFSVACAWGEAPEEGLTLSDFEVDVFRVKKTDNSITQLATDVAMSIEVGGGSYSYYLEDCDFATYDYLVVVEYEGAETLNTIVWSGKPFGDIPGVGACEPSYLRERIKTLLSLDRWAAILGIDPRHFRQVITTVKPFTSCDTVWKEHPWQENDAVSREEVAMAIQQAENTIAHYLGYKLLPTWEADERQQAPQPGAPELVYASNVDPRGFYQSSRLNWGHYLYGGIEAKTLQQANTPVAYTDADGDGYKETATLQVATTVTDAEEIAVFYPCEEGADAWEIRPLRSISISGGIATIKLWRHQLVVPDLIEALSPSQVDGDVDANFLAVVDVYRRYNDPSQQVQLIWSARPNYCECGDIACETCTFATQWGCLTGHNFSQGLVRYQAASWDADDEEYNAAQLSVCRNPDRLRLWYRAGLRDMSLQYPTLQMAPEWERAVTYLSLMYLDRPLCGCNNLDAITQHWGHDLAIEGSEVGDKITDRLLNNPFGTTRGAVFAWKLVNQRDRVLGRAVRY